MKKTARRRLRRVGRVQHRLAQQLQQILFDELRLPKTKRIRRATPPMRTPFLTRSAKSEHPSWSTCSGTVTSAARDRRWTAESNGRRLSGSTDLDPDGRFHRAAVLDRPGPTERAGPHHRGPPDPAGFRGRRPARDAAHCRLLADRDPDHGAPVRGRRLIAAFAEARTSTSPWHRGPSTSAGPGDPELRERIKAMAYGLAYGLIHVTASASSSASRPRRRGCSWTSTSSGSVGCATTSTASSTRPGRPASPRR